MKWPQFRDNVTTIDLLGDPIYFYLSFSQANLFMHNTVYITHSEEVRQFLLSEITMLCHHTWQTKHQINKNSIFVHVLLLIKNVSMKVIRQKGILVTLYTFANMNGLTWCTMWRIWHIPTFLLGTNCNTVYWAKSKVFIHNSNKNYQHQFSIAL